MLPGHFRRGGKPLLRLRFRNFVTEKDSAENGKFAKEKARGRIDGAVAAAMAIGRILGDDSGTLYETQRPEGFLFL